MDRSNSINKSNIPASLLYQLGKPTKTKWHTVRKEIGKSKEINYRFNVVEPVDTQQRQSDPYRHLAMYDSRDGMNVVQKRSTDNKFTYLTLANSTASSLKSGLRIEGNKKKSDQFQDCGDIDYRDIHRESIVLSNDPPSLTNINQNFEKIKISKFKSPLNVIEEESFGTKQPKDIQNLREILCLRLIELCRETNSLRKQIKSEEKYKFTDEEYSEFISQNINDLASSACESGSSSVKIENFIKLTASNTEEFEYYLPQFIGKIETLITNQYGNFVARTLIQYSEKFRDECRIICMKKLGYFFQNQYSISVMRRLACFSKEFCNWAFAEFQSNLDNLLQYFPESILLFSTIVEEIQPDGMFQELIEIIRWSLSRNECSPILRIASVVVDRAPERLLVQVSGILLPFTHIYIDNQIGNYVVQSLLRRKLIHVLDCVLDCFSDNPLLIFTNKYRRYVLLEVLKNWELHAGQIDKIKRVAQKIFDSLKDLFNVLNRHQRTNLLLIIITRLQCEVEFRKKLCEIASRDRQESTFYRIENARYYLYLINMLKCVTEGKYQEIFNRLHPSREEVSDTSEVKSKK